MKYLNKLFSEKRGVSPVIGVILMVAITVVMGAVIAGYAFGFLGNTPKTPNISLSVVDNPNDAVSLLVKQTGGDSLSASEWKASVTEDKDSSADFTTQTETGDKALSTGTILDVGHITPTAYTALAAGWYHVVIVHTASNAILLDTNVKVQ
jgi:archaeal type IV pilus assembly protein PilA